MLNAQVRDALVFDTSPGALPPALQYGTVARRVVETLFQESEDSNDVPESLQFAVVVKDVAKMIAAASRGRMVDVAYLADEVTAYLERIASLRDDG